MKKTYIIPSIFVSQSHLDTLLNTYSIQNGGSNNIMDFNAVDGYSKKRMIDDEENGFYSGSTSEQMQSLDIWEDQ